MLFGVVGDDDVFNEYVFYDFNVVKVVVVMIVDWLVDFDLFNFGNY